ncbi:MAG: transporter substrate-binding domain-containing protein [Gammaproteobacteria bacterium]|nr:transporter substrate-binding domain-containing protein [Gammaproteobacteria bacterium]
MAPTAIKTLVLLGTFALLLAGCGNDDPATEATITQTPRPALRVILTSHPQGLDYLPRSGLPDNDEYTLLKLYAETSGVELKNIYIAQHDQLIPALLAGEGDIVVNNLVVTGRRKQQVNFTSPIAYVHEQLIGRPGETPKSAHELQGRRVAVRRSDTSYNTLVTIHQQRFQPPFEIIEVDEELATEQLLLGVLDGRYDLAVTDSSQLKALPQSSRVEIGFDIGPVRPIAWAVHKENNALLASINDFLGRHHLVGKGDLISRGDLATIKEHQVLRVLTRNNASTYFLWRGELHGFEYELAKEFAQRHKLRLEMVVPPSRDLLIPWLREGKGDIIAAAMTPTDERQQEGITFSRPYNTVSEIVVSRSDDPIDSAEQLAGRRVVVRRSSSYWQSMEALQQQGIAFELIAAAEELETEELLAQLARGEIDLTVADSHILDIELTWRDDIRAAFALGERHHGWIVRQENPTLLRAVNAFHKSEYRGLFYNVTYDKYFRNPKQIRRHLEGRADTAGNNTLSPYDELVRKHADHYGFDWRLIVSQMYQESRFNPRAKSWAGAQGLLQVLPRTAREFGITDLHDPDNGLRAGMHYLSWLLKRFEPELEMGERTWFALAAYNAGVGHVRDARRLAVEKGWNPNKWFNHVERGMLLLAKREYAKSAKHGYVRGHEPVNYVRQIHDRYRAYLKLKGGNALAFVE